MKPYLTPKFPPPAPKQGDKGRPKIKTPKGDGFHPEEIIQGRVSVADLMPPMPKIDSILDAIGIVPEFKPGTQKAKPKKRVKPARRANNAPSFAEFAATMAVELLPDLDLERPPPMLGS